MKHTILTSLLLAVMCCGVAIAKQPPAHDSQDWYPAVVERVVDGDTLAVHIHIGWDVIIETHTRLLGFDTPELRGPDRVRGQQARTFVANWLVSCDNLILVRQHGREKYGRWLVDIQCSQTKEDLVAALTAAGHAK